jgi:acetyl esterase
MIDANYSHAPEHPFPTAVYDAVDATRWVLANTPNGRDTPKITLSGFGAGGNFELATSASFGHDTVAQLKG